MTVQYDLKRRVRTQLRLAQPRITACSAAREAFGTQATIPKLTRSSLHRCLERYGISRLPEVEGEKPRRKKFERYPIGYFHIDLAEVRTTEEKLYRFVAIDRTSKFAFVEMVERADMRTSAAFLEALIAHRPLLHPHHPDRQRHPICRSAQELERTHRSLA